MTLLTAETSTLIMPQIVLDQIKASSVKAEQTLHLGMHAGLEVRVNPYLQANTVIATDKDGTLLAIIRLGGINDEASITIIPEEERFSWKNRRTAWAAEDDSRADQEGRGYRIRIWPDHRTHWSTDQGDSSAPAEEPNLRAGSGTDRDSEAESTDRESDGSQR